MQQVFYNGTALHGLGKVIIARQALRGEPEAAPQRWRRQVQIRVHFHRTDYASNLALVRQVEQLIRTQQGTLRWVDAGTGSEWVNRPVQLTGHDWPENPNAHGTYFQALTLTFEFLDDLSATEHQALAATFTRTGTGSPTVDLGIVESFKVDRDTRRYHPLRDNREIVSGRLTARGRLKANPALPLDQRRAALLAAADQLDTEITGSGRLRYGSLDQVVRVDSFTSELDQATWDVPWSLSASYSDFPNEAGYAQAEFTVSTRQDPATNEVTRTFSGQIGAQSEAAAQAKLAAVRTSILAGADWATIRQESTSDQVNGEDGAAFHRLSFTEEFRRQVAGIVESRLETTDTDDADSGLIRRSFSGMVTAQGASHASAYAAALARARTLGHRKFQFQVAAEETTDDSSLGDAGDRVTAGPVLVAVRFRYEYRIKGTRLRVNLTTRTAKETFGQDTEAVSGTITAVDTAAAQTAYITIKNVFSTRLIRDESTSLVEERIADLGANDVPTGAQTALVLRMEFAFSMHQAKTGAVFSARYEMDVAQDFVARTKTTAVRGTAYGNDPMALNSWLGLLMAGLALGSPTASRRSTTRERAPNQDKDELDVAIAVGFDETYVAALTGTGAILQCELSEEIECSGARVVPQPTAATNDVIQTLPSVQSGRRTVTGSVVATDETTALAWAKRQRLLPTPGGFGAGGLRAAQPPRISFAPEWVPLTDGVARDGDYGAGPRTTNAKLVRCRFTFTEVFEQLTLL